MKKEKNVYVAPNCAVVEMEGAVYMLAGSFTEGSGDITTNDPNDQGANRHRGEWGNLWSNIK